MAFGIQEPTQFKSQIQSSFSEVEHTLEKAGLDPYTYRIYKRFLIRTLNSNAGYSEPQKKISDAINVSERKIRNCTKLLQLMNMIKIERFGRNTSGHFMPNIVTLTDPSEWTLKKNKDIPIP